MESDANEAVIVARRAPFKIMPFILRISDYKEIRRKQHEDNNIISYFQQEVFLLGFACTCSLYDTRPLCA